MELISLIVGIFVFIAFFTIHAGINVIRVEAVEQTRYLAAISANVAKLVNERFPGGAEQALLGGRKTT